jgi:hypothetical protein
MILEKPLDPESMGKALEYFREQVEELTREVFGEEKSIVFASGVLAGIALGKRKLENALDVVFPGESEMSPEKDNRHTLACMQLSDVVSDWPTDKIESLSRLLTDEVFVEKLHLIP